MICKIKQRENNIRSFGFHAKIWIFLNRYEYATYAHTSYTYVCYVQENKKGALYIGTYTHGLLSFYIPTRKREREAGFELNFLGPYLRRSANEKNKWRIEEPVKENK